MSLRQRRNPPAVPADTSVAVWQRPMASAAARSVEERLEEWAALCRASRSWTPEVIDLAAGLRAVARPLGELAIAYMVVGSTAASA